MWSFGCLVAELAIGEPLFSGQNEHEQLGDVSTLAEPAVVDHLVRERLNR